MADRVERLLELGGQGAAYVLHKEENIRHFSGFAGEGMLVIAQGVRRIITDFRYEEQAAIESPGWEVSVIDADHPHAKRIAQALEPLSGKVYLETDFITADQMEVFRSLLSGRELASMGGLPEKLREIKEPDEVELIAKAAHITDLAFQHALNVIRPGMTERELALELYIHMKRNGADGEAFSIIAASGPNGSLPHAVPGDRQFQPGDFITMDFGAKYGGYCSDFTRTVSVGKADAELQKIYAITLEAQLRALDALMAGKTGKAIDAIARDHITASGYGQYFGHSLGHGVGRMIHEEPRLSARSQQVLAPGAIVTVEPGIYLPGKGGVRIEDLCLVEEGGKRIFSTASKELIEL